MQRWVLARKVPKMMEAGYRKTGTMRNNGREFLMEKPDPGETGKVEKSSAKSRKVAAMPKSLRP